VGVDELHVVRYVVMRIGMVAQWLHASRRAGELRQTTIIVLGESLLASANAIIEVLHGEADLAELIALSVLTLIVTASLWWIYF